MTQSLIHSREKLPEFLRGQFGAALRQTARTGNLEFEIDRPRHQIAVEVRQYPEGCRVTLWSNDGLVGGGYVRDRFEEIWVTNTLELLVAIGQAQAAADRIAAERGVVA